MSDIQAFRVRYQKILENIRKYASGREVKLVAVSKYATLDQMELAYAEGIRCFGESRLAPSLQKQAEWNNCNRNDVDWHYIGTLQRKKVKKLLPAFQMIQSVSSFKLAECISQEAEASKVVQPVLIQLNLTEDAGKNGYVPEVLEKEFSALMGLNGITIRGFMAMAPSSLSLNQDTEGLKKFFIQIKLLRDELQEKFKNPLPELSMGMSHDYCEALKCGATIIRVGNALFKNQDLTYNR